MMPPADALKGSFSSSLRGRGGAWMLALLGALGLLTAARPAPGADSAVAANSAGQDEATRCAALAGRRLSPETVIASASYTSTGDTVAGTTVKTPFCRVLGLATPTGDSRIGFEVWLPPAAHWNG